MGSKARKPSGYVRRLESLIDATEHLNSTFDLQELLAIILDLSLRNLNADRGTIYLIDDDKNELWSNVLKGNEMSEIRLPVGQGIAGAVAKEGKTIILHDVTKDERFLSSYDKRSGFQTRSMLCHPMKNRKGRTVGVFQILNKRRGKFDEDDVMFLEAFSDHVVLAVENARFVQASIEQERIERDLQIAASIQQRIIPKVLPPIPGYELSSVAVPSKTIGGDFFDIIPLEDGRKIVLIADVSGKGIPAALIVSNLHASLRAYVQYQKDLVPLVTQLNRVVCDSTTPESFITVFILIFDPVTHTFTYVNAGHNPPYLVGKSSVRSITGGGLPLGLMEDFSYASASDEIRHGETLILYTDGIPEAMNRQKELYSEERFVASIEKAVGLSADALRDQILTDVRGFIGKEPPSDDMTMLILRRA